MKADAKWIGLHPRKFSPFKKELPITLNAGDRFLRIVFRFEVAGVVLNASGDALMPNGNWMPCYDMNLHKFGRVIGQRDLASADNTEMQDAWRECVHARIIEKLDLTREGRAVQS